MIVNLIVGDWSNDGHSKTKTITIESNLSPTEIEQAYQKAITILGFDFCEEVCHSYEDHNISKSHLDILIKNGLQLKLEPKSQSIFDPKILYLDSYSIKEFQKTGSMDLNANYFATIYLFIITLGNSKFWYEPTDSSNSINIGGYGLFY
jgi:hypothetical protein